MDESADKVHPREEAWPDGTPRFRWHVLLRPDGSEVRHGPFEAFHRNGMRAEAGNYADGERVGPWRGWDDTGHRIYEGVPEDGDADLAEEPDPSAWDEPIETAPPSPEQKRNRDRWIELLVVVAIGWLPFFGRALVSRAMLDPPETWKHIRRVDNWWSNIVSIERLTETLAILAVLLFIFSRATVKWKEMGIVRPRASALLIGLLVGAATWFGDFGLDYLLKPIAPPTRSYLPDELLSWSVLLVALVCNSLVEEFVWRGYVLAQVRTLSGSWVVALCVSTLFFASYHLYQGPAYASFIALTGLAYGALTLVTKRIWPAVVAHTVHNILFYSPLYDKLTG